MDTEYTKGFKAGLAWQKDLEGAIRQDAFIDGQQYGIIQIIKLAEDWLASWDQHEEPVEALIELIKEQYGPE